MLSLFHSIFDLEINYLVCIKGKTPFQRLLSHISMKVVAQWDVGGTSQVGMNILVPNLCGNNHVSLSCTNKVFVGTLLFQATKMLN